MVSRSRGVDSRSYYFYSRERQIRILGLALLVFSRYTIQTYPRNTRRAVSVLPTDDIDAAWPRDDRSGDLDMNDQETYDHTLDTPAPPTSDAAVQDPTLPNEPYYQQPAARRRARNASLGVALVVVGLVLFAFQVIGRS